MTGEELKRKTKAGGIVYGAMLSTARNPRWATTVAGFGLDYVIIDTEHSPQSRGDVADLIAGLRATETVPIVRIPIPDQHYVTMAIDAGAQGILAPYCETIEQVKEVVAAAKWRPLKGDLVDAVMERGELPSEASRKYLEDMNRNNVCIIGIESVPAIERLDDILGVEGVDAIFVGPNDLSISLGIPDQLDHPDYEAALRRVITACKAHGVPTLIHHQTVEMTTKWLREGARFVLHSSDTRAMHAGMTAHFNAIREVGEKVGGGEAVAIGESDEVI